MKVSMKLSEKIKDNVKGVVCVISFFAFLFLGGYIIIDYETMTNTIEKAAIVIDSDFGSENIYLVTIKDQNNKDLCLTMKNIFSFKEKNKESLIEAGDSAVVLYNPEDNKICYLLYFFETDTVSDNISGKRQPINELRERIPMPPKYRMSIWPPILLVISLLLTIYLIIYFLKRDSNLKK